MSSNFSSNPMGTCHLGGQWWTCEEQSPTFLGCCLSNPCNGIGCPAGNLTAAGMGTGSGPDAPSDDGSYWPNVSCPNGGVWFTCAKQTNSFQGCCDNSSGFNPCNGIGCPTERLHAAAFKTVPATISSTASSATSATSSVTSTASSAASSSSIANSIGHNSYQKTPVAAIVGGVLGGVIVVLLILLTLFCLQRRRKRAALTGLSEPNNQLQQDMSTVKTMLSSFVHEASLSGAKIPTNGNHGYSRTNRSFQHTNDSVDNRPMTYASSSPPFSPAPPYQSQPRSPGFSDHHEIDSITVHEVESPPLQQRSFIPQPGAAEMPDTSGDAWRSSFTRASKTGPRGQ
ncbi:hypothetical protein NHQ30_003640 [Ciborinia camelliae]|nr:hypothetical protein NHQ30_003640 [Ciborinia camelliae]